MAKSQIIKNLVNDEINLETSLYRLLVISNDLNDPALTKWIESELNGYTDDANLPDYRRVRGLEIRYSGINGGFQITNQPLPLHYISKTYREEIVNYNIMHSIRVVEKTLVNDQTYEKDLTYLSGDVYNNTGGIQCVNIVGRCNMLEVGNIYNEVKSKTLKILLTLEKEFGNLDDLDISIDDILNEKLDEVKSVINLIIYDKSISIGNDNQIKNSEFITKEK